uniref:Ig-like domain-containing protein n=1 Tax=Glossina brevipalpis TaxID=37001 RepID=A0A1A9X2R0_9MUSC
MGAIKLKYRLFGEHLKRAQSHKCYQKKTDLRNSFVLWAYQAKFYTSKATLRLFRSLKTVASDKSYIMMTVLLVVSIVLSGNTALAAQRESLKTKDPNSISNNANSISNSIGDSSNGPGSANMVNQESANNINNGNSNSDYTAANTIRASSSSTITSVLSTISNPGLGYVTTTSTQVNNAVGTSTILSSSPQKNLNTGNAGINRNNIETLESGQNGPYFDKTVSRNITALLGKTAYLNCRVKNLGNKTMLLQVSWVRHRDIHLLTVGRYTYTSDQRFRAIHQPQTEDWILQIKYPQHRDSGIYECQVSTTPHMSHYIHLNVVEPSTEIIGAPDLYIESGSTINLTCVILNSPEPPAYIFWNHNNAIINYDSPRGGVSVVTIKGETTTSFLLIKSARPSDSGHYQCNPSNAKPKSVTVHVLNGVSHSVSRGIPSSNAARGTSVSSNVSKSIYLSVPVNVLVYLSVYHSIRKAIVIGWGQARLHVTATAMRLVGILTLLLIPNVKNLYNLRLSNNDNDDDDDHDDSVTTTKICYYFHKAQLRLIEEMWPLSGVLLRCTNIVRYNELSAKWQSNRFNLKCCYCCYYYHYYYSLSRSGQQQLSKQHLKFLYTPKMDIS